MTVLNLAPASPAGVFTVAPSGDTTGATDVARIQAAVNTASAATFGNQGGTVTLGNGIFYVNAPIAITTDNITIAGQGAGNPAGSGAGPNPLYGGTVIKATAGFTGSYVLTFGHTGSPTTTLSGCFIRDFSIDGQSAVASVSGIFWQVFKGGGQHVYVSKMTNHGIVMDGNGSSVFPNGCWDNHFWDVTADTPTNHGWKLQNFATDNSFTECTSKFTGGNGFDLDANSTANRWTGGYIYACTGKAVNSTTAMQLKFIGVRFQDCNGGIYMTSAFINGGFLIEGCTFRNMSFAGDGLTDAINYLPTVATFGGSVIGCDFTCDVGLGNGTVNVWNRPRYLINIASAFCHNVQIAPFGESSTRTDGLVYATGYIQNLGTNTVVSGAKGASGLPEFFFGGGQRIMFRTGSPAGVVTALAGSICINQSGGAGTTLFVSEAGGTAWVGK